MLLRTARPLIVAAAVLAGVRAPGPRGLVSRVLEQVAVHAALTALIGAAYFGIIAAGRWSQPWLGSDLSRWWGLAAALAAGALFHPLRLRLREAASRLFGTWHDPYRLADLVSRTVQEAEGPVEALASAASWVRRALGARGVAVEVPLPGGRTRTVVDGEIPAPDPGDDPTDGPTDDGGHAAVPLVWHGRHVGLLLVRGEPRDAGLLDILARQLAEVAHAVRLSADLQRSRERMLVTREEERHRLRRDLHDGLGPTLTSLAMSVDEARLTLARDPDAAETLLSRARRQMTEAVMDVRNLVYGLRPPGLDRSQLDELGLEGALRTLAAAPGPRVDVVATGAPAEVPAAVEAAAYEIAREALANVRRHARATTALVRLEQREDALRLTVSDDGLGLPEQRRQGAELMRQHAERAGGACDLAVRPGGGTEVTALLPLGAPR
ncbi:histidine kinase [Nonomuraea pusilla]|uniref:sensor histidine kinase n=1 Tax=Nonomuraea pusilla TaxID=46177 RepID=UPI00332B2C98